MARLRKLQMARWARGRRRVSAPVSVLAIAVVAVTTVALTGAFTGALSVGSGATGQALTRQQAAQRILKTQAAQVMTSPAQAALRMQATGSKDLSPGLSPAGISVRRQSRPATGGGAQSQPAFSHVRVNDPSLDTPQPHQTPPGAPSAAAAAPPVADGYGDKPALATGPDPVVTGRDNLYAAWDDFSFNTVNGKFFTGLPVASSTDGGATWHLAYAKRFDLTNVRGCSFKQFIGATPIVNPADGTLYVVAERLAVNDPKCTGAPEQRSEWIFRSTDGGKTFGPGVRIAGVIEAVPSDLLFLGPGKYMRDLEFPAIALRGK